MSRREELSVGKLVAGAAAGQGFVTIAGTTFAIVCCGLSAAETDADATVTINNSAIVATDIPFAVVAAATTAQAVTKAVCGAGSLTVSLAGNGGAGTQLAYLVLRAT